MNDLERLADEIAAAETVVALTGAGISAPSGVPTFRGDDGVWDRFDEGQFHRDRFLRDPEGFWRDRLALREAMYGDEYEPNAAHEALAALAAGSALDAILTQNTDGLHERARTDAAADRGGAGDGAVAADASAPDGEGATLLELHGTARRVVCVDCGRRADAEPVLADVRDGDVPPRCSCGGVYEPDVVLFGEELPPAVLERARSFARRSDVFLAIGTSLVVEPAASLPRLAARSGATVAVVNVAETPCDDLAAVVVREDVTTALPRLRSAVRER